MRPGHRCAGRRSAWLGLAALTLVALAAGSHESAAQDSDSGPQAPPASYSSETLEDLRRAMATKWLDGKINVFIAQALVFGQRGSNDLYCSPWVSVSNSSDKEVAELFVGIDYQADANGAPGKVGQPVGSTFSRFRKINVGASEDSYFHRLRADHCIGLRGKMHVVRCAYVGGKDCAADVQAIAYGSIPLEKK